MFVSREPRRESESSTHVGRGGAANVVRLEGEEGEKARGENAVWESVVVGRVRRGRGRERGRGRGRGGWRIKEGSGCWVRSRAFEVRAEWLPVGMVALAVWCDERRDALRKGMVMTRRLIYFALLFPAFHYVDCTGFGKG